MTYPFASIEKKWQSYWEEHSTFRVTESPTKKKLYILDMFPYPSGSGLHVGHPEGYTATDIYCRYMRMQGYNVLHPMGWDAFGLPAERYAMQTGIHPAVTTIDNITNFRRQIKMLGLSYDWAREISTTDPKYYKWTQWIFLQLFNSWYDRETHRARPVSELVIPPGLSERERYEYIASRRLAYLSDMPVNWCAQLGTVLANEEIAEWVDKGYTVERRMMRQWMLRITEYADRLDADLNDLQWPPGIIEMQRNWIGKSEGAEIDFALAGLDAKIRVYTTRPDTIFGATYMVLAPEHPLLDSITADGQRGAVRDYQEMTRKKSEIERTALDRKKSGVFTGGYAINPASGNKIPVWIADYVLLTYGTGAIMAVPAHDSRDFEFADSYRLPVLDVVAGDGRSEAFFEGEGISINSSNGKDLSLDGLPSSAAKKTVIEWLDRRKIGGAAVKYKLRDWLFSRQRYWGEPFPLIYLEDGTVKPLPESELPVLLPDVESFRPSGSGESVLATAEKWVNTVDPETRKPARRETHTMPQWAGSCWYYLRYLDPDNDARFVSPEKERYWMPADLYVGGAEHAVLHLLYARFWHKVLYDLGYLTTVEPFQRLINQGTILGEDGQKMSKSRGNVVNPDDVVQGYGADSLRLFEMFMGPLEDTKPWSMRGVDGVHRFLNRVWRMIVDEEGNVLPSVRDVAMSDSQERLLHQSIHKVTSDLNGLSFNTAISQMMIFVNEFLNLEVKPRQAIETFVLLLSPFAPHLAEEIWQKLGHDESLAYAAWPRFDETKMKEQSVEIVVQVNGKVRTKFQVAPGTAEDTLRSTALMDETVKRHIEGKEIVKSIVIPDRLVSFVVRDR